jgi:hypothetical protein
VRQAFSHPVRAHAGGDCTYMSHLFLSRNVEGGRPGRRADGRAGALASLTAALLPPRRLRHPTVGDVAADVPGARSHTEFPSAFSSARLLRLQLLGREDFIGSPCPGVCTHCDPIMPA